MGGRAVGVAGRVGDVGRVGGGRGGGVDMRLKWTLGKRRFHPRIVNGIMGQRSLENGGESRRNRPHDPHNCLAMHTINTDSRGTIEYR